MKEIFYFLGKKEEFYEENFKEIRGYFELKYPSRMKFTKSNKIENFSGLNEYDIIILDNPKMENFCDIEKMANEGDIILLTEKNMPQKELTKLSKTHHVYGTDEFFLKEGIEKLLGFK